MHAQYKILLRYFMEISDTVLKGEVQKHKLN